MHSISHIALSLQRALLGAVSPNLRMVASDWDEEKQTFHIYFYFDGNISDDDFEAASCVGTEVAADYPDGVGVSEHCVRLDFPQKLPQHSLVVHWRKESI